MNHEFKILSESEKYEIIKAPVLEALYAASDDHEIKEGEKAEAVKLAHFKTFTSEEELIPFYKEVYKNFQRNFEEAIQKYTPFDESKRKILKEEIDKISQIISKLDKRFANRLQKSLVDYAEHVKKAGRGNVINFVFPLPVPGITD